jgi:hypothetical protein
MFVGQCRSTWIAHHIGLYPGCVRQYLTSDVGLNELHILTNLFELETFIAEVDAIDVLDVDACGTVSFLRHDVTDATVLCFILILESDFFVSSSACCWIEEAVAVVSSGIPSGNGDVVGYVDGGQSRVLGGGVSNGRGTLVAEDLLSSRGRFGWRGISGEWRRLGGCKVGVLRSWTDPMAGLQGAKGCGRVHVGIIGKRWMW